MANRVAGACERVADDILEGFKQLGQSPSLVRFTTGSSAGPAGVIGFDLGDGRVQQVSVNGMRIAEYLAHLIPGMQGYPITMQ